MPEDKFDAIIVGGGVAGLSAAIVLARGGAEVLLVERGNYCGAKNVTGGRLYTHSLEKILPGFVEKAPLERKITKERYAYRRDGKLTISEYGVSDVCAPEGDSYSVVRGTFDKWLSEQAENEGAEIVCGILVDSLIMDGDMVCGVVAGGDEMLADVVILADGVNSQLAQKIGLRSDLTPETTVGGAKEVIEIGADELEKRFGLGKEEGLAWMFKNCSDDNNICDGFLYTNKTSVSVGITIPVSEIGVDEISVAQRMEDFKNSDLIAPLVRGGRLLEYSAHLIPRQSKGAMPRFSGNGVILVGDSASLAADFGYTLRGMDLAIESGRLAAENVLNAKESGDFSADSLAGYDTALKRSFVLNCVEQSSVIRRDIEKADLGADAANTINHVVDKYYSFGLETGI
jgi:electron transfer flavoprotein-quinone oxidoreductase